MRVCWHVACLTVHDKVVQTGSDVPDRRARRRPNGKTKGGSVMRTVLGITLALLLGLGVAGAWAENISGKIQSVDPGERAFVLDDGSKLWVAEGVSMDALKESYEERDGKKVATSVEVSD